MKSLVLIFLIWLIAAPVGSRADDLESDQLKQFTSSAFYKSIIDNSMSRFSDTVFKRCPNLVSPASTVRIIKPVSFGQNGRPDAGMWKQSFPVSGCGNDTILNLFFTARSDQKLNIIPGSSGTTHADLTLQVDAVQYARMGAGTVIQQCDRFYVRNTRFEAYGLLIPAVADPGPGDPMRPWHETWTMAGCGRIVDVPLSFAPDEKGTQIIMQQNGIMERK